MIFLKISRNGKDLNDVSHDAEVITIGAAQDNLVPLVGEGVHAHHAQIEARTLLVTDLGSPSFGVTVNGDRITAPKALENGDEIGIGEYVFRFFHSGAAHGSVTDTRTWKVPAGTMCGKPAIGDPAKTIKL